MPIKSCLRQEHESKFEGHTLFYGKESLIWNEICNSGLTLKGQIISKAIFVFLTSSKKQKKKDLSCYIIVLFVFRKKLGKQKLLSKLTDL